MHYDDLINSEEPLRQALRSLYPEAEISAIRYIDHSFRGKRRDAVERQTTRRYQSLKSRIDQLRSTVP